MLVASAHIGQQVEPGSTCVAGLDAVSAFVVEQQAVVIAIFLTFVFEIFPAEIFVFFRMIEN